MALVLRSETIYVFKRRKDVEILPHLALYLCGVITIGVFDGRAEDVLRHDNLEAMDHAN